MKFIYTTMPRMRRIMRDRFRSETGLKRLRAARWLLNNCNDTQLMNVFNLANLTEAAALRVRLQNKETKLVAWETERAQMLAAEAAAALEEGE